MLVCAILISTRDPAIPLKFADTMWEHGGLAWLGGDGDIRLRLAFGAFPIAVSSFAIFFPSYDDGEFSMRAKWHSPRRAGSSALKKALDTPNAVSNTRLPDCA